MDIQQYISSGIIETYALGIATAAEARELESLAAAHPEIQVALEEYQHVLGLYTQKHSVTPPSGLKDKIWQEIVQKEDPRPLQDEGGAVIDFASGQHKKFRLLRYGIAAALILLVGSVALNVTFWSQHQNLENHVAAIEKEQSVMRASNQNYAKQLALMLNPDIKRIPLAGVGDHSANSALVFWDSQSKVVYLSLNKLPPAPRGKQYQLWAIVDGKPVSAGVYPLSKDAVLQKMNSIPQAQMFAVTLEKEGGVASPTMDQMYAAGKI